MHGQYGAHGDMAHIHEYTTESGRKIKLNDESAKHFIPFLNEMEKMGMPYTRQGDYDSFNDRKIRGGSSWSQHSYANAVDLEATGFNPTPEMAEWQKKHMGPMRAAMRRHGIVWGGDMHRRDAPHYEWGGGGGPLKGTAPQQQPPVTPPPVIPPLITRLTHDPVKPHPEHQSFLKDAKIILASLHEKQKMFSVGSHARPSLSRHDGTKNQNVNIEIASTDPHTAASEIARHMSDLQSHTLKTWRAA